MLEKLSDRVPVIACCVLFLIGADASAQAPIVIDHTCTNLRRVPDSWIEAAKTRFKVAYGHTSHGSQIISGMDLIKGEPGSLYWFDRDGTAGGLSLHDYTRAGDLGNPDRTTWEARTRDVLDDPGNDRNLVIWSWCGQADTSAENMQIYLDLMSGLAADYPDVTFVYMTGHLNGTGEEGNLHRRNDQIRQHVTASNAVLFDFADIESYDPDGSYFRDRYADDGCNYSGGNWADQWCAANPASELCASCFCAHSRSLNCNLKGRAFWWMLARLAGWDGVTFGEESACEDGIDNDGDGRIDFDPVTYADPGDESTPPSGSGDPGCIDRSSATESPDCQDGIDNDGDGMRDYDGGLSTSGSADPVGPDPQCVGRPWGIIETSSPRCGLGAELTFPLAALIWLYRRRRSRI